MSTHVTPLWHMIRNILIRQPRLNDLGQRRIRITEDEARSLPQGTCAVRVYSGGAWVSHNGTDYVLQEGQTLSLREDCLGAVVTSIGRQPVVLELLG